MSGSFLDTTIVVLLAEDQQPLAGRVNAFLTSNRPVEFPYYALRELLAGHLRVLCDVHNRIKASTNIGEALEALASMNPLVGRKKSAALSAFAGSLKREFQKRPAGDRDQLGPEMARDIALQVFRIWERARRSKSGGMVHPLACFGDGPLTVGEAGELRGPNNSFNCEPTARCAAAGYMSDNQAALSKMCDALHPERLSPAARKKNENIQRRKALKELRDNGPQKFDKRRCRALGDAYFAAMCPTDSNVITTNVVDFEPLCSAIGKKAVSP